MLFTFNVAAYSQRIAVLDFNAGAGVTQADVDGISAIFNTYFSPKGYTLVERTQIDRVIDEQNFQRGKITQDQMVRIGQILNVSNVVMGDINMVMGQYNVDVRIVDVESGTIIAKDGTTWSPGSSYRTMMNKLASNLTTKLTGNSSVDKNSSASSKSTSNSKERSSVEMLYGYLNVFPKEIGTFNSIPNKVIEQINSQEQYGYDSWRIPNEEELSILQANGYTSSGKYMTKENPTGIVLLVTEKPSAELLRMKENGLGLNGIYDIGYYYNRDGVSGYVCSVSEDGKHGTIVTTKLKVFKLDDICIDCPSHITTRKVPEFMAQIKEIPNWKEKYTWLAWAEEELGEGWYIPDAFSLQSLAYTAITTDEDGHYAYPNLHIFTDSNFLSSSPDGEGSFFYVYCASRSDISLLSGINVHMYLE